MAAYDVPAGISLAQNVLILVMLATCYLVQKRDVVVLITSGQVLVNLFVHSSAVACLMPPSMVQLTVRTRISMAQSVRSPVHEDTVLKALIREPAASGTV